MAQVARTFLCSCGKGRFLFACFVHWCHQHDVTWAATGSGCCKTTSRRPCGAPFCVAHVLHHTGGHLPRSHRTSRTSRGATSQPPGNGGPAGQQPGQRHRRDSPQSARIADTVPNLTPEAITEPGRGWRRPEAEVASVTAQKDQCVADVEAAERRLERLQDSAPSAMQQEPAELVQLQSRIDELIRERDTLRVSAIQGHVEVAASSAEEVNMLRANVDSLERERAMLRGRGGPMSCKCRPVRVDVDFDRPRRHSGEGEWVIEPVQPVEAVTRESRYGLRAVRVGEASHPGPPMVASSRCRGRVRHRFVVLSSDDEERVPRTVPASADLRRRGEVDQPESRHVASEPFPEVFPMTDDSEVASVPQRRRRLVDTDSRCVRSISSSGCAQQETGHRRCPDHRSIQWSRLSLTRNSTTRPIPRVSSPGAGFLTLRAKLRSLLFLNRGCLSSWRPWERFNRSFEWLAGVDLEAVFSQRPSLMKSVPGFMRGAYRSAMRVALTEIDQGRSDGDSSRSSRGWKLFLLLPQLLLHKPPRGGQVPKKQLQRRFESFTDGDWAHLLATSIDCASRAAQASSCRSRRRDPDNLEARAARAEALTQMGELSAARLALEGAAVAPGTRATLAALQDPERRPLCSETPSHLIS